MEVGRQGRGWLQDALGRFVVSLLPLSLESCIDYNRCPRGVVLKFIRLFAIIFRIGIAYQIHNDVIVLFLKLVEKPWKGPRGLFIVELGRHKPLAKCSR